jgi:hypothetical protein
MSPKHILALALIALGSLSVANVRAEASAKESWGGKHIELTVIGESVCFDFDCAVGYVMSGWKMGSKGVITAEGTTVSFTGRPPGPGAGNQRVPVATRFTAKITGNKMTLTLTAKGKSTRFELVKGAQAELYRCM